MGLANITPTTVTLDSKIAEINTLIDELNAKVNDAKGLLDSNVLPMDRCHGLFARRDHAWKDLNEMIVSGIYAADPTNANVPIQQYGIVLVFLPSGTGDGSGTSSSDWVYQIFISTTTGAKNIYWRRNVNQSGWDGWYSVTGTKV